MDGNGPCSVTLTGKNESSGDVRRPARSERWKTGLRAVGPLGVSLLLHGILGWTLVGGHVPGIFASEPSRPSPQPLRFELVETPDSALSEQPADESQLFSDKSTRAQDPDESETDQTDNHRPRVLDDGEQKDLRPVAQSPTQSAEPSLAPASRPATARPAIQEAAEDRPDVEPTEEGELARREEMRQDESTPSPAAPETAAGQAFRMGAPQEGRRNPSPAERDELARTLATGEFSYAATEHFFAEYLLNLRRRVDVQWTLQVMTGIVVPGKREAVVDFLVLADGSITGLRTRKLIGDVDFASMCTKSIRVAAPFGPVPYDRVPGMSDALDGTPLRIRFTFSYH